MSDFRAIPALIDGPYRFRIDNDRQTAESVSADATISDPPMVAIDGTIDRGFRKTAGRPFLRWNNRRWSNRWTISLPDR